jgi:signal transduction histidine kinase
MRSSIRVKLLAAFALDLVLMVSLGWFAAQQMARMNERAAFVEQQTIPSLDRVARIATVINSYRVRQLEYLIYSNLADKERSKQKMGALEQAMAGYFADYQPLINAPREDARFRAVATAWDAVVAANYQRFIPAVALANSGSVQPFYSRMNPLYDQLERAMAQLAEENQSQATDALDEVRSAYEGARSFILADTVATSVISGALGLILSGRIALRISRLTGATARVAAGELDRTVEVMSQDELGRLAQSFNQMVESLRAQRSALQQRNSEIQASLRRQEQLTEDLILRQQAEEAAHRAQTAAEAANQAKSMFLATMSHELRTPLNAILGYAQLMRMARGAVAIDDLELDPLERILAAGRHLTALITNVLDFSKIEQGKIELSIKEVAVAGLLREAVDVVAPLAQRQANTLRVIDAPDLGVMTTDPGKLRQILINLLANAAKFTDHGVITLHAWRAERAAPAGDGQPSDLIFEVSDTGIGIAPEHLGQLFQPFSQLDASVTRRYEGTGLGLALSRQLCLTLGGDVSVVSELNRGTTFTVRLPAVAPARPPTQPHRAVEAPARPRADRSEQVFA